MTKADDNRAVSALFRVFGGAVRDAPADRRKKTRRNAMHRGEVWVFGILVPFTLWCALAEWLGPWLGVPGGGVLAVPLAFLAVNTLPFVLAGKSPVWQWRLWFCAALLWAWYHREAGGLSQFIAYAWGVVFVLNTLAVCFLCEIWILRRSGSMLRSCLLLGVHVAALGLGYFHGWSWAFAAGGMIAAGYCLAVLRPGAQWLGPVLCHTDDRGILLTIDDGPDPETTPALLDLLDRHGRKAVFFLIGEKVRAHPELAREIAERGHEIGNHTQTHPQASFWCAGPWRTRREITAAQEAIREITGVSPRWFRAPVGHRNFFTHPVAESLGLEVMAWNRRGFDAVERDVGKILGRIVPHLAPGDIVLLHDATPIAGEVLSGVLAALDQDTR